MFSPKNHSGEKAMGFLAKMKLDSFQYFWCMNKSGRFNFGDIDNQRKNVMKPAESKTKTKRHHKSILVSLKFLKNKTNSIEQFEYFHCKPSWKKFF